MVKKSDSLTAREEAIMEEAFMSGMEEAFMSGRVYAHGGENESPVEIREKLYRLQVNMTKDALKKIDAMKERLEATSRTQVLKSSLKFYNFVMNEKAKDEDVKIILKDSKGNEKEVIF